MGKPICESPTCLLPAALGGRYCWEHAYEQSSALCLVADCPHPHEPRAVLCSSHHQEVLAHQASLRRQGLKPSPLRVWLVGRLRKEVALG